MIATHPVGDLSSGTAAPPDCAGDGPRWLDTYALAYAFGIVWLAIAMVALGIRPLFEFDAGYDALLVMPPLATALCVLIADRHGTVRSLPWRALALATVSGVVSVLSTVLLTPFLVLMFRQGVGYNLGASGAIAASALVVVASPMIVCLVTSVRRKLFGRALVLLVGLAVAGVALAMALAPGGPIAALMRLDQAEITMITSSWWLPVYAATAAFARRLGLA
jgi:FlaA1/EpsC-like NDP-sugar epimerase